MPRKYSRESTKGLAGNYYVSEFLVAYRDIANANGGKSPARLAEPVIDFDLAKTKKNLKVKSVDLVFATVANSIVFSEMKMDVTSPNQSEHLATEIRDKINSSRTFFSGKGTFAKDQTSYVLLSNRNPKLQVITSRLKKFLQPHRNKTGDVEILEESAFEGIFFGEG